jgi:hypothetical protein
MAALPYSIIIGWGLATLLRAAWPATLAAPRPLKVAAGALQAGALAVLILAATVATDVRQERNREWRAQSEHWELLARELKENVPEAPPGSRFVILYGHWHDVWATALVRTIYGDDTLVASSVSPERTSNLDYQVGPKDIVFFNMQGNFYPSTRR